MELESSETFNILKMGSEENFETSFTEILEDLIPNAFVEVRHFTKHLPSPKTIPKNQRRFTFQQARNKAKENCFTCINERANVHLDFSNVTGNKSEQLWPEDFTGSITHKKGYLAVAVTETEHYSSIGIDLEIIEQRDNELLVRDIIPEGLPPGIDELSAKVISFSCKEAIFKAQYQLIHRNLSFNEVVISWDPAPSTYSQYSGSAQLPHGLEIPFKCQILGTWVISAARIPS